MLRFSLAFALAAMASGAPAQAQTFPSQPVKLIVTFAPGGTTDVLARAVAQKMSENLKESVVVDNRPGAAGNLGMGVLARAAPDGHTIAIGTLSTLAISPAASKNMPYNARRDFAPVAMMTEVPVVLAVPADFPANNLAEFVDYAKKNPTKMNFSSNGAGSSTHMAGELLKRKYGFEMAHVPQGGDAPILNSLMGGHIQLGIIAAPPAVEFAKAGKIKLLAIISAKRNAALPDVPTLGEAGAPEVVGSTWFGFMVPAGTPNNIVALLNRELNRAMEAPDTKKVFTIGGLEPTMMSVEQFGAFVASEQDRWATIVQTLGVTQE